MTKDLVLINQAFSEELKEYRYSRTFRDSIHFGGRLNSLFTVLPKSIRNGILEKYGLVEIDISNCAFKIFNAMSSITPLSDDFYEILARNYLETVKGHTDLYKPLPTHMPKSYRKIWKAIGTRAAGVSSEQTFIKAVTQLLSEIGCIYSKEEKDHSIKSFKIQSKDQLWKEFCIKNKVLLEERILLSPQFILKSFNETTKDSFCHLLFNNSSLVFQNAESNALVRTLKEMVADGLIPLACHDAIFVPSEFQEKYEELFPKLIQEEAVVREIVRLKSLEDTIWETPDGELNQTIGNSCLPPELIRVMIA